MSTEGKLDLVARKCAQCSAPLGASTQCTYCGTTYEQVRVEKAQPPNPAEWKDRPILAENLSLHDAVALVEEILGQTDRRAKEILPTKIIDEKEQIKREIEQETFLAYLAEVMICLLPILVSSLMVYMSITNIDANTFEENKSFFTDIILVLVSLLALAASVSLIASSDARKVYFDLTIWRFVKDDVNRALEARRSWIEHDSYQLAAEQASDTDIQHLHLALGVLVDSDNDSDISAEQKQTLIQKVLEVLNPNKQRIMQFGLTRHISMLS